MALALISLGSNIAPETHLPAAIEQLRQHLRITVHRVSAVYESEPVGTTSPQSRYHNAAALIETDLDPAALRAALREIEAALGRVRTADKFAARTIDLDIAMIGEQIIHDGTSDIPDPGITRYAHVAVPLADVAPGWVHPELGVTLKQIADDLLRDEEELR